MNNSSWTLNISQLPSWFGAIQAFSFVAILVNNILVLTTFKRMKKLTMLHHFMIGLCVADLVTALPYSIVFFTTVNGSITLTQSLCDTWGVTFMVTIATTTWIHSAMCIEKCISILHPILHRNFQKSKYAAYITMGIVMTCFLLPVIISTILLQYEVVKIVFLPFIPSCLYDSDIRVYVVWGGLYVIAPMITQVVTHILIFKATRANSERLGNIQKRAQRSKLRVMKTLSITLGLYYACWLPVIVQVIWNSAKEHTLPEWFDVVTLHTLIANSGLSFAIYACSLPAFQQQVQNIFPKCSRGSRNRIDY